MKKLCYGNADNPAIWMNAGKHSLHYWEAWYGVRPEKVKRIRLKCPRCGRKVLSSIRTCHDGCCLVHLLPPHKPKGWWKKKRHKKGAKVR